MNSKSNLTKIVLINGVVFSILIIFIELAFGDWRKLVISKDRFSTIPALIKDRTLRYDAKNVYGETSEILIKYIRDKDGYRSKLSPTSKKIVLTVGGSTTDQRYLTEGDTWQDYLDKEVVEFDFVNGGVDGQSSYGHLVSINSWHSTSLNPKNIHAILFYIGVNDMGLLEGRVSDYNMPTTFPSKVKFYLNQYSFIYNRIIKTINRQEKSEIVNLAAHGGRKKRFTNLSRGEKFTINREKNYIYYTELFSSLLRQSIISFPASRIVLVQQHVPGCKFESPFKGLDIHFYPKDQNYKKNDFVFSGAKVCKRMGEVFWVQNQVAKSKEFLDIVEISPMYLQNILTKEDVYDYIHTNPKGSKKIGKYIKSSHLFPTEK